MEGIGRVSGVIVVGGACGVGRLTEGFDGWDRGGAWSDQGKFDAERVVLEEWEWFLSWPRKRFRVG